MLDQVVPNLQFANNAPLAGNNSSSQVFIRGIGQTDPTSTVDPGVGMYIDDVYIGNAVGGSMAAARHFESCRCCAARRARCSGATPSAARSCCRPQIRATSSAAQHGSEPAIDSLIDAFVALDVPFSDTFKTRFSAGMRKQDGYVHSHGRHDLGDTNTFTAARRRSGRRSDKFRGDVRLAITRKSDENGSPLVFAAITETATFPRVASLDAGCPGLTTAQCRRPDFPISRRCR